MVNAWSLLYDEYYGTMNETFPVKNTEPDDTIKISTGSTESAGPKFVSFDLNDPNFNVGIDTSNYEYTITGGYFRFEWIKSRWMHCQLGHGPRPSIYGTWYTTQSGY